MKKIRFTERREYQINGPGHPDNPVYLPGQEETLRNDLADRWLNRGAAELVEDMGPDEREFAGVDAIIVEEIKQSVVDDQTEGMEALDAATEKLQGAVAGE